MTLNFKAVGESGQIAFATSATEPGTTATVISTKSMTNFAVPVTITLPFGHQVIVIKQLGGTLTRNGTPPRVFDSDPGQGRSSLIDSCCDLL